MTTRTYKRLTNVSFWIAIAAAFLFDRVPSYSWLLGSLAAVALLVAGAAHFYTLRHPLKEDPLPEESFDRLDTGFLLSSDSDVVFWKEKNLHTHRFILGATSPAKSVFVANLIYLSEPQKARFDAHYVTELVQKLAASPRTASCEVHITPEGSLMVRMMAVKFPFERTMTAFEEKLKAFETPPPRPS